MEKDEIKRSQECQFPAKFPRPHRPLIPRGEFSTAAKHKSCFRGCSKYFMCMHSAKSMSYLPILLTKGVEPREVTRAGPQSR